MTLAATSQPIERTTCAHLSISPDGAVRSTRFDDFYFKPGRGAEETGYVFLQGNQLEQRWRDALIAAPASAMPHAADLSRRASLSRSADLSRSAMHFSIAETGFGSGLNFLATLALWCSVHQGLPAASQPALYYYTTEKYPLTRAALAKVLDHYNPFPDCASALLDQYPDAIGGDYALRFNLHGCRVYLVLLFGDSVDALNRLEHYPAATGGKPNPAALAIDAWYLDGFAPAKNPAMWREELFAAIGRHSRRGTSAATFSAARPARDGLTAAGFTIAKRAGFAHKRDMLTAQFAGASNAAATGSANRKYFSLAPCYARAVASETHGESPFNTSANAPARTNDRITKTALVIGAGIAGCSTAAMLAERGWRVTVVDQHALPAAGASGNRAAILYARTASQRAGLADFYEASFHYAVNFYHRLAATTAQRDLAGGLRGMLMLGQQLDARWQANNPETASRKNVDAAEASALAGISLKKNGIYYPHSGFLQPHQICQALLDAPAITFVGAQDIAALEQHDTSWRATGAGGYTTRADVVVVACGTASHRFHQCQWLPLKALRGQTTDLPSQAALAPLQIALCEKGYCTPALTDSAKTGALARPMHSIGATYNTDFIGGELRAVDHRDNIDKLAEMLGYDPLRAQPLDARALAELGGRASSRCVAPDYLPMVGSVVDHDVFLQRFASLRDNARRTPNASAPHLPGLYVNTAYGSHGFTMAPLASEILVAEIDRAPFPIGDTLRQALSPSRFLVRQLIKTNPATTKPNASQRGFTPSS